MVLYDDIRTHLFKVGPSKAADITRALGVSQPSFSRALREDSERSKGPKIIRFGRAQTTKYALVREIEGISLPIRVYEFQSDGKSIGLGRLWSVQPRGYVFESEIKKLHGYYDDLPYFLDDLRPIGYLGRLLPKRHPELELPTDIRAWSGDHCLRYLTRYGSDHMGAVVLGDVPFQNILARESEMDRLIEEDDRARVYKELAEDLLKYGAHGSSAAGEQPKFLISIRKRGELLVKFSPPTHTELGQRRSDLLVAEHLASEVLAKNGKDASKTNIFKSGDRTFLEVERFDRVARVGRRGVISLHALDGEFVGKLASWESTSIELVSQKIISEEDLNEVLWRAAFGELIANSDMHHGNLSFYFDQGDVKGVAPIYDMLPMAYAPRNEQVVDVEFKLPIPSPSVANIWYTAWEVAVKFWAAVSSDERISLLFREIGKANLKKTQDLKAIIQRLPRT